MPIGRRTFRTATGKRKLAVVIDEILFLRIKHLSVLDRRPLHAIVESGLKAYLRDVKDHKWPVEWLDPSKLHENLVTFS
jgi:hypothetical protein